MWCTPIGCHLHARLFHCMFGLDKALHPTTVYTPHVTTYAPLHFPPLCLMFNCDGHALDGWAEAGVTPFPSPALDDAINIDGIGW